jgi:hypothetical protein
MPGSAVHYQTKAPFKTVISGDEELLVVHPGATDQDLLIVANQPDGTFTAGANVVMIDGEGTLVEDLRVIVTPFEGPSATVRIHGWSDKSGHRETATYLCSAFCVDASAGRPRNKGMGDADSLTVTRYRDGSTATSKTWSTPPTAPKG